MNKIAPRGVVAGAPLLAGLPETDSGRVMADAVLREFRPQRVLCREGEPATALFLVQSGRVRFVRATPQGREILVRWFGPGECFGLGSLAPGPVNYMATAVTAGPAHLFRWDAAAIRSAAATFPRLAQNALGVVLEYLEEYSERHVALLSKTAEQRLARTITHLGVTFGQVLPTGVEVRIANRELAALADVGEFTVSRQLRQWERHGHLEKRRQYLLIRHPEALHERVADRTTRPRDGT